MDLSHCFHQIQTETQTQFLNLTATPQREAPKEFRKSSPFSSPEEDAISSSSDIGLRSEQRQSILENGSAYSKSPFESKTKPQVPGSPGFAVLPVVRLHSIEEFATP